MPGFKTRKNISFLGGYGHPPNVEAVEYFIANVMPGLKDKHPEIHFNIYGSQLPKKLIDLANDTVNMQGYVEVIDQVYNENKIFIAPLQSGAGIKGKVLGALAYGIPTILSPVAAEGIGLRDGVETLIAKTPDQWIEAIEKLHYDPALWLNISKAGQEYVNTFYSFSAGEKLMAEALENVDIFI
ncbi:MAG: glycosyltransferase [Gammaproteobacteria bacterium]|nr:glycosyltransferase [Gammaproteobacteria bacterium]MBT4146525.1 glycosyltransferase [Gammaproteobacteria bacterium]MBT5222399.1 glycosyltransferase [Gammaproteobacteria bacterium]MBT5826547.1 glycosyltransferase [Gammaproteobacteria bacterium]MBT5966329.1 glycosyltransferase [Gammaproteobacteria bacterium]